MVIVDRLKCLLKEKRLVTLVFGPGSYTGNIVKIDLDDCIVTIVDRGDLYNRLVELDIFSIIAIEVFPANNKYDLPKRKPLTVNMKSKKRRKKSMIL